MGHKMLLHAFLALSAVLLHVCRSVCSWRTSQSSAPWIEVSSWAWLGLHAPSNTMLDPQSSSRAVTVTISASSGRDLCACCATSMWTRPPGGASIGPRALSQPPHTT